MAGFSASSSIARRPRALIMVQGQLLAPMECSAHVSLHQSADTFYAKLPLDNSAGLDEKFWLDTAPIDVTIRGTNDVDGEGYVDLLVGSTDRTGVDLLNRVVEIRGRDLTAKLTDMKTSEKWLNRSSKDIITDLAGRAGLSVKFSGDTEQAGLQFDQDFNEISDLDAAWNVIVDAARRLGCIAFIKGKTLYIQPIDKDPDDFYEFKYQRPTPEQVASGNFVMLYLERNLNLAKDMEITVKSWQHKQGENVTSQYESKGKSASNDRTIYQFRGANLTKTQQDRMARKHLRETLTHERAVMADNMPGDVNVIPGLQGLRLSGTGTKADQDYILSDAVHRFTTDGGYLMDISAHSQDAARGEPKQLQ